MVFRDKRLKFRQILTTEHNLFYKDIKGQLAFAYFTTLSKDLGLVAVLISTMNITESRGTSGGTAILIGLETGGAGGSPVVLERGHQ